MCDQPYQPDTQQHWEPRHRYVTEWTTDDEFDPWESRADAARQEWADDE